ncbi:MAG: hypothetical protein HY905_18890 [Deltaproteobacteria bacterium]|nr:hypothetical protein [Deltaproteobacteria bacterium]
MIVRGSGTDFTRGECSASFPRGEAVVSLVRTEAPDRIRLLLEIPADAPEGPATLALETPSGEFTPEFTILPAETEASAHFVPDTVVAGYGADLAVAGIGTHFEEGVTGVSFAEDSGIGVRGLAVESETELRVWVEVSATSWDRTVAASVSTRSQVLGASLHVLAATDRCGLDIDPPGGLRGTRATVMITATCDGFPFGDHPEIGFPWGTGIEVAGDPVVLPADADNPERIRAELDLAADASIGTRTLLVTTADGRTASGPFTVLIGADETRSCTFLSTVRAGDRHEPVQALGRNTNWAYEGTTAVSASPLVTVESVFAPRSTMALLVLTVADDAPARPVTMTITSGGETVSCDLTVEEPADAACSLRPETLEHPAGDTDTDIDVDLVVTGLDLTSLPATLDSEPGSGLKVRSFRVRDAENATAQVRVSRDAPWGNSEFRLVAGATRLSCPIRVSRTTPAAPRIVPDYLLIDGRPHEMSFASSDPSFLDGARPWPAALRTDIPGLEVTASAPPGADGWDFTALSSLALDPGHVSVSAHGHRTSGGRARHLAARVDAVPLARVYGEVRHPPLYAGGSTVTALVQAPPGVLGPDTVVVPPPRAGLVAGGLTVIPGPDGSTAYFSLGADQSTPPGNHVLVLVSRGIAVPAVIEVSEGDPGSFEGIAVGAGADVEVTLDGVRPDGGPTAWTSSTRAELGAPDPDFVSLERREVTRPDQARVRVQVAPSVTWRGGHLAWMRTGRTVDTGLVWLDAPARDLHVSPGWLHAGRAAQVELSGTDVDPAVSTARAVEGLANVSVHGREAGKLTLDLLAAEPGADEADGGLAVLEVDLDGSGVFVALVLPVLPAPPSVSPTETMLARRPGAQPITARIQGLDVGSGVSARVATGGAAGDELVVGVPTLTPPDLISVDAAIALDATADRPRWIVFLSDEGAAAMGVLPAGGLPRALGVDAAPETVGVAPEAPVVRALAATADLAAVRASCDDPERVLVSLVARDGITLLARGDGGSPLPHAIPAAAEDAAAGFLVIDAEVPTICELRYASWLAYDPYFDIGDNDDAGVEESLSDDLASAHLGRLDEGYDIDRYEVDLPRGARLEAFAGQPDDYAGRTELALEVVDEDGTGVTADPWDEGTGGVAALTVGAAGRWRIAVRAVAGSDGPYVLSIHEPVLLDEIDLWSGGPRFVELSAAPGAALDGWRLVHRSASGSVVAETTLAGSARTDGSFVVAAIPFAGADALWPALAAVTSPATLALVDRSGRDVDLVGLGGAPGEGAAVLDPPAPPEAPASLGRCLHVDTDDNVADFWRLRAASPGEPNDCAYAE